MSTSNSLSYQDFAPQAYASNVAQALRQLVAAVFAVEPLSAAAPVAAVSEYQNEAGGFSMADAYDQFTPNLAAELRFMASRG